MSPQPALNTVSPELTGELDIESIIKRRLREVINNPTKYKLWIEPLKVSLRNDVVVFEAPNVVWEKKVKSFIPSCFNEWLNENLSVTEYKISLNQTGNPSRKNDGLKPLGQISEQLPLQGFKRNTNLNPKCTLENFLVCDDLEKQRLAFLKSFIESDNYLLYLLSNSGMGKTHLVNAIGNFFDKEGVGKVYFVDAGRFQQHVVNRYGDKSSGAFDEIYSGLGLLIIDNVERVTGPKTQQNLALMLDEAEQQGRKIILTSNSFPNQLVFKDKSLQGKLSSCSPFKLPDMSRGTRLKFLNDLINKQSNLKGQIDEDSVNYIVDQLLLPRALKEVIRSLSDYVVMSGGERLTRNVMKKIIEPMISVEAITPENIVRLTKLAYGFKPEYNPKSNVPNEVSYRGSLVALLGHFTDLSQQEIFKYIGRNRSGFTSTMKKHREALEEDTGYAKRYDVLVTLIENRKFDIKEFPPLGGQKSLYF